MIVDDKLKEKLDWHLNRIFENKEELYYKEKYISGFSVSNECEEIYKEALWNIIDAAKELEDYMKEQECNFE